MSIWHLKQYDQYFDINTYAFHIATSYALDKFEALEVNQIKKYESVTKQISSKSLMTKHESQSV